VLTTHLSLSLSYWEMTASSSALGACYLAVAARGIQPRRSVFAGLAIVAFGIAFNPHLNGIGPALLLASLPVMLVAVYIAFKALDDGHSEPL
jgi:hypothetical protein